MSDLFRQEAIEAQQQRWSGDVSSIRPVSAWAAVALLCTIALAAAVFLFAGNYTRKERVSGVIASIEGVVRLRVQENAVITALLVKDGEQVSAGEPIAELTRERFSDAGPTLLMTDKNLDEQRASVLRRAKETTAALDAGVVAIRDRVARLNSDIVHLGEEIRLQGEQIASVERIITNLKPLAEDKIISDLQYQQQLNQLLDQRARLETLKRTRDGMQSEILLARSELRGLQAKAAAELATVDQSRIALDREKVQLHGDSVMQLRAPVDGIVTAITAVVGQRIDPSVTIASVVPRNAKMQAILHVPSTAIGFMRVGQSVALRYDAYPYQKFGQHAGTVVKISEADLPATEQELTGAAKDKANLFRVRVALNRDYVEAYGARYPLRPGLTLHADVELDRRRLIDWIFEPLVALGKRL